MGMGYGRRPETSDDRHVLTKHAEIYPGDAQLQHIHRAVAHTERALKSLSDALADSARQKVPAPYGLATSNRLTFKYGQI